MAEADRPGGDPDDAALLALFGAITSRDHCDIRQRLDSSGELVARRVRIGASRHGPDGYFLVPIRHYVYAGDTALHIAGAAHQRGTAELLVGKSADVRARNRRGAEPLHYAADGSPGAEYWDPAAQRDVIAYLSEAGADPNAFDNSGVAPLHRAVRTRSEAAVNALIINGADPRLMNKSGSTPLHLAVQNTGRSDSGSDAAKDEQARIIAVLLEHGASPNDPMRKARPSQPLLPVTGSVTCSPTADPYSLAPPAPLRHVRLCPRLISIRWAMISPRLDSPCRAGASGDAPVAVRHFHRLRREQVKDWRHQWPS